jgi:uroporphyrinogen decarboxylase-like protein
MTGKERIKAAMDLKPVDQIPFMCQMSIGHMLIQLNVSPLEFWFDKDVYKNGLIKLREQYGFDGILVSLYGHDPNWRDRIVEIKKTDEFEIGEFENGDKIICPYNDLPYYVFAKLPNSILLQDIVEENLISELNYIPVSQNLPFYINSNHMLEILDDLVISEGHKFSIHGEITSPFDYYLDYLGHEDALIGLLDYPEKAKLVLAHFTKLLKELAAKMCDTGVDAIKISSPFAGAGFISPDDYMKFIFPFEKEIVQTIRKKNVHVYIHTCGAINDRLELIFESGATGIECLDPEPLGNVELSDAKRRIGSTGFIKGNIDSVNLLLEGTQEEIKLDTKNRLEIGSPGSGFILSTACSIAPNVSKENIQLLKKVVKEWK